MTLDELKQLVPLSVVRKMFPATPVKNIETHLPTILAALVEAGLTNRPMVLMALGTIRAETESFLPIDEGASKYNTEPGGPLFGKYDFAKRLGNGAVGDGARYKGRGFIQLTGKHNYTVYGKAIGVPLVSNPDRANEPETAAKLLVAFLKANQKGIETALKLGELVEARKLVNGGTHGMDRFAAAYGTGSKLLKEW